MFTLLHIDSKLFELYGKEVRVKLQPGRPLRNLSVFKFRPTRRKHIKVVILSH